MGVSPACGFPPRGVHVIRRLLAARFSVHCGNISRCRSTAKHPGTHCCGIGMPRRGGPAAASYDAAPQPRRSAE